jgi:AcrR family transcriptional regulator
MRTVEREHGVKSHERGSNGRVRPDLKGSNSPSDATCAMHDRILTAAEQVVVRDGVGSLTLEAVARQAGVSKGGLLYHFPSKSELIIAIVERLGKRCETAHAGSMAEDGESAGAFTRAYLAARSAGPDPQKRPILTALLAAAGTDQHYLEPMHKRARQWQQKLEDDGIDPATATIVRLAIDGLCMCGLFGMPVPEGQLRRDVIEKLTAMSREKESASSRRRKGK